MPIEQAEVLAVHVDAVCCKTKGLVRTKGATLLPPNILIFPVWTVDPTTIEANPSLKTAPAPLHNDAGNVIPQVTAVALLAQELVLMPMVLVAVRGMICKLPSRVLERICAPLLKVRLSA